VISLQKVDSLVVFDGNEELKRFLRYKAGGIWIKIHLNPKPEFHPSISRVPSD
jgi:hypothetical protein